MVDFWNISKISQTTANSNNLIIYPVDSQIFPLNIHSSIPTLINVDYSNCIFLKYPEIL